MLKTLLLRNVKNFWTNSLSQPADYDKNIPFDLSQFPPAKMVQDESAFAASM